jgi:hypothetical protein
MRWLVPLLAFFSFALTVCAGVMALKSSSVLVLGEIELLVGVAVFVIFGLLLLNVVLALKDFHRK